MNWAANIRLFREKPNWESVNTVPSPTHRSGGRRFGGLWWHGARLPLTRSFIPPSRVRHCLSQLFEIPRCLISRIFLGHLAAPGPVGPPSLQTTALRSGIYRSGSIGFQRIRPKKPDALILVCLASSGVTFSALLINSLWCMSFTYPHSRITPHWTDLF